MSLKTQSPEVLTSILSQCWRFKKSRNWQQDSEDLLDGLFSPPRQACVIKFFLSLVSFRLVPWYLEFSCRISEGRVRAETSSHMSGGASPWWWVPKPLWAGPNQNLPWCLSLSAFRSWHLGRDVPSFRMMGFSPHPLNSSLSLSQIKKNSAAAGFRGVFPVLYYVWSHTTSSSHFASASVST